MARFLATLPLLAALLGGCVMVPAPTAPGPKLAGLTELKVVVPQPATVSTVSDLAVVGWNRARLTITPDGGKSPATAHLLEAHDGVLMFDDILGGLPPGKYDVKLDLEQTLANGNDLVVATGTLTGDTAANFHVGANSLEVMVHPVQTGTHIAITPTSVDDALSHEYGHTGPPPPTSTDATTVASDVGAAVLVGVLEGAAIAAQASHTSSSGSDTPPPQSYSSPDPGQSDGSTWSGSSGDGSDSSSSNDGSDGSNTTKRVTIR